MNARIHVDATYAGKRAITLPQPNLIPQQLQSALSRRYARLLTLVKTLASLSEMPGGSAFFTLLSFLLGPP